MKHKKTSGNRRKFDVLLSTATSQCAMMTLKPGEASEEEPHNEHPQSEQWLYVISGAGEAIAKSGTRRRRVRLSAGSLLLVEKRELHQVRCTGDASLVTLNFYSPLAYTPGGEPKQKKYSTARGRAHRSGGREDR
jgi:mannose-6-phosphate isomerase-like protein (cupin superfamily)